ncbi:MAG: hypothetical protein AB4080_12610 [Trichodesmium sp.]
MNQVDTANKHSKKTSDTQGSATNEPRCLMAVKPNHNLLSSHSINYQGGDTS